jgi:hypothetical protein
MFRTANPRVLCGLAGLIFVWTAGACSGREKGTITYPVSSPSPLRELPMVIENHSPKTVEVNLLIGEMGTPIGLIGALSSATFDVAPFAALPDKLRFEARMFVDSGEEEGVALTEADEVVWVSPYLDLDAARSLKLTLAPDLASSTLEADTADGDLDL